jgi:hypothetical protein
VPIVPLYSSQPVQENPFRGPPQAQDLRSLGFDPTAFKAATDLGEAVSKVADEAKQKADQVVVLGADDKLSKYETELLHAPKTGALNQLGENALALPDQVKGQWDKKVEEVGKDLQNDTQRLAFQRTAQARYNDIDKNVQVHVSTQVKKLDDATTDSYIKNEQSAAAAAADPKVFDAQRIGVSIERQQAALTDYAARNGMPADEVKAKMEDITSKTHGLVVQKLLANEADIQAKNYYDAVKDQVSGTDQIQLDKALEEGTLRGESQRKSDAILSSAKDQLDALSQTKSITDPRLRDETERRVVQFYNEQKAAEKEVQSDLYLKAANVVDSSPGKTARDAIDPVTYSKLDLSQREALDARSNNVPNDNKKWLDFLELNSDQIGGLSRADFEVNYWSKFDKPHRERAETQWNAAQEAKLKGIQDPKLTSTLTFKDRIDETLRAIGVVDPATEKSKFSAHEVLEYARFEQAASSALEHYELNDLGGKRHATQDEMQKIIDGLAMKKVTINNWFSSPEKPAVVVKDDEAAKAYVPIQKIPQGDQNQIGNLMRNKQTKVTTDKMQRAYAAYLRGDRKLFDSIIGE